MNINMDYIRSVSGILKIVEMVMVLTALLVLRLSGASDSLFAFETDGFYIGVGIMFTSLLVTPLLFATYLMGKMEIQNTVFEFSMNFLLFFFLTVFGVVDMIHFTTNYSVSGSTQDCGITAGVFALLAAIAYLGDTIMAVFNYRN